jgi:hypothetical protein
MIDDRWWFDASPEFRQRVIDTLIQWARTIAPQAGLPLARPWTDAIEPDIGSEDSDEFESAWNKLVAIETHESRGRDHEPEIVVRMTRYTIDRMF